MQPRRRKLLEVAGVLALLRAGTPVHVGRGLIAAAGSTGTSLARAQAARLIPTPSQPEGPFYPREIPADHDEDLVSVIGRPKQAKGTVLHLAGTVSGDDGQVLAEAVVEIWQCDANGRYHHVDDGGGGLERDPDFQGYGRTRTDRDGGYRFRTIRPVPYPGRAPHIHLRVSHPRIRSLTTQMYVAGDSLAGESGYFRGMTGRERLTVAVSPVVDGRDSGALKAHFDLVLALR